MIPACYYPREGAADSSEPHSKANDSHAIAHSTPQSEYLSALTAQTKAR